MAISKEFKPSGAWSNPELEPLYQKLKPVKSSVKQIKPTGEMKEETIQILTFLFPTALTIRERV